MLYIRKIIKNVTSATSLLLDTTSEVVLFHGLLLLIVINPSLLYSNRMVKSGEAESGPAFIEIRSPESRDATDEEVASLRHVIDKLPRKVWVSLMVSGAERFTYYSISTPWRK